jgi:hypothetical protein
MRTEGDDDERRNSWCRGHSRNPPAVAAPLSVSFDRPRIIDIRGADHGIGINNLTMKEPQFGHSENPVMPRVPVIEGYRVLKLLRSTFAPNASVPATSSGSHP